MRPIPGRAYVFIAITCLVAVPFLALGVQDVLGDEPPTVAFYIWALCVLLSLRPIRIATNVELSASEVAVLAGVVLLPPGTLALVAGSARFVNDLVTRKSPIRILRNSAAQAISAGVAAMSFQLVIMSMVDRVTGTIGEVIVAGAVAATALVVLDLGQIIALQLILGTERLTRSTLDWIGRTGRAGNRGSAITLVAPGEELSMRAVERLTGQVLERIVLPGFGGVKTAERVTPKPFGNLKHASVAGRRSFRPRRASR